MSRPSLPWMKLETCYVLNILAYLSPLGPSSMKTSHSLPLTKWTKIINFRNFENIFHCVKTLHYSTIPNSLLQAWIPLNNRDSNLIFFLILLKTLVLLFLLPCSSFFLQSANENSLGTYCIRLDTRQSFTSASLILLVNIPRI